MKQEFYKDMAQRTNTIALFGELFMLLRSRTQSLISYGFERLEDQIMLVFMVLRIIMEKTLAEDSCTLDDLTGSMIELNADLFHLPLDYYAFHNLANLIVDKILSNSGEPISFQAFKKDAYQANPLYLSSTVIYDNGVKKASYKMSEDGFKLMLSTLEMEENMQLQFRDLVLKMQLERKNYARALDEIRHIFEILKMKEIELQEKTAQIRQDARLLSAKNYQQMIEENFQIMSDSRERFEHYSQDVVSQISDLNLKLQNSEIEGSDYENLQMLRKIHVMMQRSIVALASILKALTSFSAVFSDELALQFRAGAFRRYSFSSLVMDPVLENPDLLDRIDHYLHSLFIKQPKPIFSLYPAFEYRQLINKDENEGFEEVDEGYDLEAEKKKKEEERKRKEKLNQSLRLLLEALIEKEDHKISLFEFGQPEGFLEDLDQAKTLLSSFASAKTISIEELENDMETLVLDEDIPYSFPLSMMENYMKLPALKNYAFLKVEKTEGTAEYRFDDDLPIKVTIDNLKFTLEKRSGDESE